MSYKYALDVFCHLDPLFLPFPFLELQTTKNVTPNTLPTAKRNSIISLYLHIIGSHRLEGEFVLNLFQLTIPD